ncbi:hypothetical protein pb186bvf_019608 [Paramecium bursaria]
MFILDKQNLILESDNGSLYVGGYQAAQNQEFLNQQGIKTVITAAQGLPLKLPQNIKHHVLPISDMEHFNISQYFPHAYTLIDQGLQQGGVLGTHQQNYGSLVHCAAGVSRSVTLVIAYLMKKNNLSFNKALFMVRSSRAQAQPNLGFQKQLEAYEQQLQREQKRLNQIPLGKKSSLQKPDPQQEYAYFPQLKNRKQSYQNPYQVQYNKALAKSFSSSRQISSSRNNSLNKK